MESIATRIERHSVPALRGAMERWYRRVISLDLLIVLPLAALLFGLSVAAGYWDGIIFSPPWINLLGEPWITQAVLVAVIACGIVGIHFWLRRLVAHQVARTLTDDQGPGSLARAFLKNTRARMSVFRSTPIGWGGASRKTIHRAHEAADQFVQKLNDRYTNPSGGSAPQAAEATSNEGASPPEPVRQASG